MADETEEGKTEESKAATEAPAEGAAADAPAESEAAADAPAEGEATADAPAEGEAAADAPAEGEAAADAPAEGESAAEEGGADDWGAAMAEQGAGEATVVEAAPVVEQPAPVPVAQPRPAASFGQLRTEAAGKGISNLELILDIPVTISVELGRTQLYIKDLISLGQGAVMELDKMAGDPMEIFVNGHLVAKGETVVVNDKFGVKLTDIVSPTERISNLT
jgi:flagellar motor switch protein FliN/FliY